MNVMMARHLWFFTALMASATLWAQEPLRDPTRPDFSASVPSQASRPRVASREVGQLPRVEVLVLGPDQKWAIVNGQMITQGDRWQNGVVVDFSERGVLLQREAKTQRISPSPEVVKTFLATEILFPTNTPANTATPPALIPRRHP